MVIKANMRGGHMLILPLVALLSLLIAGCGAGGASVSRPTATATPSPTPTPRVLYQADWTGGASQWKLAPGWKATSTGLSNSGTATSSVYIPYTPSASRYTIEIVLQVNAVIGASACGNAYGVQAQTANGDAVYYAVIACMDRQFHGESEIYSATDIKQFSTYDFTPGRSPHSYTIIVDGPYVTYLLNGAELGTVKCDRPTAPNRLLLLNTNLETLIQSITITTPGAGGGRSLRRVQARCNYKFRQLRLAFFRSELELGVFSRRAIGRCTHQPQVEAIRTPLKDRTGIGNQFGVLRYRPWRRARKPCQCGVASPIDHSYRAIRQAPYDSWPPQISSRRGRQLTVATPGRAVIQAPQNRNPALAAKHDI
jgi:hypothetical protein